MKIIETVGSWGVKTSDAMGRLGIPRPGDSVYVGNLDEYPFTGRSWFRIAGINEDGRYVLVSADPEANDLCSIFLDEDGARCTSGGPFAGVDREDLVPSYELKVVRFWNWGDNFPGKGQGVDYMLHRPVFILSADANHSHKRR